MQHGRRVKGKQNAHTPRTVTELTGRAHVLTSGALRARTPHTSTGENCIGVHTHKHAPAHCTRIHSPLIGLLLRLIGLLLRLRLGLNKRTGD